MTPPTDGVVHPPSDSSPAAGGEHPAVAIRRAFQEHERLRAFLDANGFRGRAPVDVVIELVNDLVVRPR